jgi:hypothetical protein
MYPSYSFRWPKSTTRIAIYSHRSVISIRSRTRVTIDCIGSISIKFRSRVMYGFKTPKFEFPIKRAQIDFWFIGFRRYVRGPTEINPQLPPNIVVAWTIPSSLNICLGFFEALQYFEQCYFKIQCDEFPINGRTLTFGRSDIARVRGPTEVNPQSS